MTGQGYELDSGLRDLKEALRRLDLKTARQRATPVGAGGGITGTGTGDITGTLPDGVTVVAVNGLPPSWKNPVRVATTAYGTLATAYENGDSVDGVTLATGDRILLKDQTAGAENGIYTVNATGAPTRAADMDGASEVVGAIVYVTSGTANGGETLRNTNTATPTLGTDASTFAPYAASTGGDHGALTGLGDDDHTQYVAKATLTTKGDLYAASAASTPARLPVGTNDYVLTADSGASLGVSWQLATGGIGEILISDTPSTPLIFADLLQNEAQDDLLYADT